MKITKILPLLFILVSGTALSYDRHHYQNHHNQHYSANNLSNDAYQFERSVRSLKKTLKYATGYSHLTRDTKVLLKQARHFRRNIDNRVSKFYLRKDYKTLRQSYKHLKRQIALAHNIHHKKYVSYKIRKMTDRFYELRSTANQKLRKQYYRRWSHAWY